MTYTVEIRPAAARQLKKLTRVVQEQVIQQLEELELDPRRSLEWMGVGEGAIAFCQASNTKSAIRLPIFPIPL